MCARFLPPRSPRPGGSRWRRAPEAVVPEPSEPSTTTPPQAAPHPHAPPPQPPWPPAESEHPPAHPKAPPPPSVAGLPPYEPSTTTSDRPRRGILARAKRSTIGIGLVVVVAFFAGLLLNGDRWSEAELEGDLAATLQRHAVVATSTTCNRHDQTVICTVRSVTPEVPSTFTVTGEIELIERRYADDDGDVNWQIPAQVIAP